MIGGLVTIGFGLILSFTGFGMIFGIPIMAVGAIIIIFSLISKTTKLAVKGAKALSVEDNSYPLDLDTITLPETKECISCAEDIKFEAKKCRYCSEIYSLESIETEKERFKEKVREKAREKNFSNKEK